ncbi:MAG: hypothetical protein DRI39_08760, partial [Chloroflexi bacterium]
NMAQSIPQLFVAAQQLMGLFGGRGLPSVQTPMQGAPQGGNTFQSTQQWGSIEEATDEEIAEAFGG